MALLKFLRRPAETTDANKTATGTAEAVQEARTRARRRLIGAVLLLGMGVIGFPLVFQTQPRPIPVDIPIEIPRRDAVPPLTVGAGVGGNPARQAAAGDKAARAAGEMPLEPAGVAAPNTAKVAPQANTPVASAPGSTPPPVRETVEVVVPPKAVEKPADKANEKPAEKLAEKPAEKTSDKANDKGRFVVQAGSYTDAEVVREVRAKLEKMGLKTYTQAVEIDGVSRTRVRVGPYASRQEAVDVQNKIRAAGVAAALLTL